MSIIALLAGGQNVLPRVAEQVLYVDVRADAGAPSTVEHLALGGPDSARVLDPKLLPVSAILGRADDMRDDLIVAQENVLPGFKAACASRGALFA